VLFTDGTRAGIRDLGPAWRLPGRASLFGLPQLEKDAQMEFTIFRYSWLKSDARDTAPHIAN
jgi:hypothetical protein